MNPIIAQQEPIENDQYLRRSPPCALFSGDFSEAARAAAVDYIKESHQKVSAGALKSYFSKRFNISPIRARRTVSQLVRSGDLSYTYEHGGSYLEVSMMQPVRLGHRLALLPPGWETSSVADDTTVALRIQTGAAFGCGRHPTTRLALRGAEAVLSDLMPWPIAGKVSTALDIGTGSGILAIAALKLGIHSAVGVDRDPCARAEALINARLNDLETRFEITEKPLRDLAPGAAFTLILANLRSPTLLSLRERAAELLEPYGALVLSGIKIDEQPALIKAYAQYRLHTCWSEEDKGWAGIVLRPESKI